MISGAFAVLSPSGKRYFLHMIQVQLKHSARKQPTYFFRRSISPGASKGIPVPKVPDGMEVGHAKSGMPFLRKIVA